MLVISEKEKEAKDVKEKGSREKREEETKGATVCQMSALWRCEYPLWGCFVISSHSVDYFAP